MPKDKKPPLQTRKRKRPIGFTSGEISASFYVVGFLIGIIGVWRINDMRTDFAQYQQYLPLANALSFVMFMVIVAFVFMMASMLWTNLIVGKYNLWPLSDKVKGDFTTELSVGANNRVEVILSPVGPVGITMGYKDGNKIDHIDFGDSNLIWPNGNKVLISPDLFSRNLNIDNAIGWTLMKQHFGMVGFDLYNHALKNNEVLVNVDLEDPNKLMGSEKKVVEAGKA